MGRDAGDLGRSKGTWKEADGKKEAEGSWKHEVRTTWRDAVVACPWEVALLGGMAC